MRKLAIVSFTILVLLDLAHTSVADMREMLNRVSERISAGDFSADVSNKLTIYYKNKVIILDDSCDDGRNKLIDTKQGKIYHQGNSYMILYNSDNKSFRREITVNADKVEITFRILIRENIRSGLIYYRLHCPKEVFNGAKYNYVAGWISSSPKFSSGVFDYDKDYKNRMLISTVRYFQIKSEKLALSFDFNPEGPWLCAGGNYSRMWCCSISADGMGYKISRIRTYSHFGNLMIGKIIIRAGNINYRKIHPVEQFSYTMDVKRNLVINFSYDKDKMEYRSWHPGMKVANISWLKAENLQIVSRADNSFVYKDFITSKNKSIPAELIIKNLPSGLYWLTFTIFDPEEDTGLFSVLCNNKILLKNVKIDASEHWVKTIPIWLSKSGTKIKFVGNWKLNAIAIQLIMSREEDYQFNREYWHFKRPHER